jgi:cytoskeletal protein RodZ
MIGGIFADVLAGLVFIICFIVVVGLLVVLVRFLLVATKAAEIYIAKNGPARPTVESTPAATSPTTTTTPAATRTRAPKAPPTT